jgi:hypothetical protein
MIGPARPNGFERTRPAERARPSGPGRVGPAELARPSRPGRAGPAERARPSGLGQREPAEWARLSGPRRAGRPSGPGRTGLPELFRAGRAGPAERARPNGTNGPESPDSLALIARPHAGLFPAQADPPAYSESSPAAQVCGWRWRGAGVGARPGQSSGCRGAAALSTARGHGSSGQPGPDPRARPTRGPAGCSLAGGPGSTLWHFKFKLGRLRSWPSRARYARDSDPVGAVPRPPAAACVKNSLKIWELLYHQNFNI